ncbi:MAG: hypothetical protein KDH88_18415 [Chromatiales bacterium]|nr:hypothetical protein [Chromatiales bacterium]
MKLRLLFLFFFCLCQSPVFAGDIVGQVTVYARDGKEPLSSFADAVVYVDGVQTPPPPKAAILDQSGKQFLPRVLPVVRGQTVEFWNRDAVQHNVFSPHPQHGFDLGRYPRDEFRSVVFEQADRYKIYCDLHQRMIADILVLPNRYFAVSDESGSYRIEGVPPGNYVLRAWHIFGGSNSTAVSVGETESRADFSLVSTKVVREIETHKDKRGRDYLDRFFNN